MNKLLREINCSREGAFTLVETLVAIFIIGVISISIMPIFAYSIRGIRQAGDLNREVFKSHGEVQYDLAQRVSFGGTEIPIRFEDEGQETVVRGALIQRGDLLTFVANLAYISIFPTQITEGYNPATTIVEINGTDTNFEDGITKFTLIDSNGNIIGGYNSQILNHREANLNLLTNNLINANGPYTIKIETNISEGLEVQEPQVVRARLRVGLPEFLLLGSQLGEQAVSADGEYWVEKEVPNALSEEVTNDISSNRNKFIAVGDKGNIMVLRDGKNWSKLSPVSTKDLRSIRYNNKDEEFWVVGDEGAILRPSNGLNWKVVDVDPIYKESVEGLNAMPAIEFDGVHNLLQVEGINITGDYSVFGVVLDADEEQARVSDEIIKLIDNSLVIGEGFEGFIGEVLIYDRVLENEEENRVRSYLANKYGFEKTQGGLGEEPVGPKLWFKAESLEFDNDDLVSQWNDNISDKVGRTRPRDLKGIAWSDEQVVIVGERGRILVYQEQKEDWYAFDLELEEDINSIAWSDKEEVFVAVGDNGTLVSSDDGKSWEIINMNNVSSNLNDIVWNDETQRFIIVGDDCEVIRLSSTGKAERANYNENESYNLYSIAYNSRSGEFIVVGEDHISKEGVVLILDKNFERLNKEYVNNSGEFRGVTGRN
ncbi:YCF48-related protein [Halonatronum saccharophilum]|uniref:YCF48-related protein n=1 Tax=Halonatronum saccharophilum TaxID=150060 RepID=UPI0004830602|nr:YCF48-related protein [Halonatronum saccharophilum]